MADGKVFGNDGDSEQWSTFEGRAWFPIGPNSSNFPQSERESDRGRVCYVISISSADLI